MKNKWEKLFHPKRRWYAQNSLNIQSRRRAFTNWTLLFVHRRARTRDDVSYTKHTPYAIRVPSMLCVSITNKCMWVCEQNAHGADQYGSVEYGCERSIFFLSHFRKANNATFDASNGCAHDRFRLSWNQILFSIASPMSPKTTPMLIVYLT